MAAWSMKLLARVTGKMRVVSVRLGKGATPFLTDATKEAVQADRRVLPDPKFSTNYSPRQSGSFRKSIALSTGSLISRNTTLTRVVSVIIPAILLF